MPAATECRARGNACSGGGLADAVRFDPDFAALIDFALGRPPGVWFGGVHTSSWIFLPYWRGKWEGEIVLVVRAWMTAVFSAGTPAVARRRLARTERPLGSR